MTGEKAQHQTTCMLVRFSFGTTSPVTVQYTTLPVNIDVPTLGTFTGEKNLDITLPTNHSGIEDRPGRIRGPVTLVPFDTLSLGYVHPEVAVSIWSYNLDDSALVTEFVGVLGSGKRSPGGKKGIYQTDILGSKSRIVHLRVSMPANFECANIFQGPVCQADASGEIQVGTVASVNASNNRITTSFSSLSNDKYARGTLDINGAKYLIRAVSGANVFTYKQPNPAIVGESCILNPGCRKRYSDCQFWNNTSRFNGLGIGMPKKNPSFEA